MVLYDYEGEPKRNVSPLMPDPVEHALVEAGWGEVFTRHEPGLLQALVSASLHEMVEKTVHR